MPAKKEASTPPVAESFEDAADELEKIIQVLEQEPTSLAKLLDDFERGQALLSYCQITLKSAHKRLDIVEAKLKADSTEEELDNSFEKNKALNDDDVRLL
ncbi:MAG: exodeoxyribonuclease VII small subunit [Paracoccaceae bacterium]|jgi:exodeoxyribonuclease VII small subunit